MATAESLKDDHLTCSICYRPFTEPKTLQCLHTFCYGCLQTHVAHSMSIRGIQCPVCRHVTPPPDPLKSRNLWAGLIKTDFKLAGILEALVELEKSKKSQAEGIVITSSSNNITDRKTQLTTMLQVLRPAIGFIQGKIENEKDKVQTMSDTKEETIAQIQQTVSDIKDDIQAKQKKMFEEVDKTFETEKMECEANINRFQKLVDETKDTIGLIDRLLSPGSEYATQECLPRIQKQQEEVMKFVTDPPSCDNVLKFSFSANLKSVQTALKGLELGLVSLKPTEFNIMAVQEVLKCTGSKGDKSATPDVPQQEVAQPEPALALPPTDSTDRDDSESSRSGDMQIAYKLERQIESKHAEDSYVPLIKDIVILQGKTSPVVIVLDYDNASVKALHKVDGESKVTSHRFSGYPQSISRLPDERVVVSLMNYKFIIFTAELKQISVSESDKWYSCLSTVTTQDKVFGFVNTSLTTVVGGRLNKLEYVTMKGKPATKFLNSSPSEEHFTDITSLCSTPSNNVVVSDSVGRSVLCVTLEGEITWRVTGPEIGHPAGLACDSKGDVYVVDKEGGRVVKILGETGSLIGEVLTEGLENPLAIGIDVADKLYVSQQNGKVCIFSLDV